MGDEDTLLRHYSAILRRRKWAVILPLVVTPVVAWLLVARQEPVYGASSQVLLSQHDLAQAVSGIPVVEQTDRSLATQADLARVPEVARNVLRAVPDSGMTVNELLDASSVASKLNSDLLEFTVQAPTPALALRLAGAYATRYARYRQQLDSALVRAAQRALDRRIRTLKGNRASPAVVAALVERREQLTTLQALQETPAFVVREPQRAEQVEPRPLRSLALGLAVGLLLGLGLALLWEELDTRVRSPEEIERRLGLPLLARLPTPRQRPGEHDRVAMLERRDSKDLEPFRILRANLELVMLRRDIRSIMVTSAVQGEGKSTTAANLAVALARTGVRVALCDLDGRQPALHRLFRLDGSAGLIDVALGSVPIKSALAAIPVDGHGSASARAESHDLLVLPFGDVGSATAEFAVSNAVAHVLSQLQYRADLVLIDAPPLLVSGEAVALTSKVDGILVVANLRKLRRPAIGELARLLSASAATKLGVVITGVSAESDFGYGHEPRVVPVTSAERAGRAAV